MKYFLILGIVIVLGSQIVYADNYVYNMTDSEQREFNLMALCYGSDIKIDALAFHNISLTQWCAERYGGINTLYGEAIK